MRFRCMQYCREKLLYTPSTAPLHQPYPVTRRLQSSAAIQYTALQRSTVYNLYNTPLRKVEHCRPPRRSSRVGQSLLTHKEVGIIFLLVHTFATL